MMSDQNAKPVFVLCIENKDCEDLETRKLYQVLPDQEAEKEGYLRIIDESGEDYLYPSNNFVVISLPDAAVEAIWADGTLF